MRASGSGTIGSLLGIVVDICLLRKGPQDVPSSSVLTGLAMAISVLMGVWVEALVSTGEHLLTRPLLTTAASIGFVFVLLSARGYGARFRQTWTAFAGAGALLTLVFVPILWSLGREIRADQAPNPVGYLAFWFLTIWSFVIDAHIFRHALSVSFTVGFLFATLAFALMTMLRYLIFPT